VQRKEDKVMLKNFKKDGLLNFSKPSVPIESKMYKVEPPIELEYCSGCTFFPVPWKNVELVAKHNH